MKTVRIILLLAICAASCTVEKSDPVKLEICLAATEDMEGSTAMSMKGTDEIFFVSNEVVLTSADIESAGTSSVHDMPIVELELTDAGAKKFAKFTGENIEKHAAIIIDGELVTAPLIKEKIAEGRALINGLFTEEEAERIAAGLNAAAR